MTMRATEPLLREFPEQSEWDAVVIGAGHNGLIAAAYLAKAGLKVALVERRYEIGGGMATEEILFPGYYTNLHAVYHMMVDYIPVFSDFDLDRHSLVFTKPNAQTAMVFEDGSSILLTRMLEDTRDSIAKFSRKDADTFGKLMENWRRMVKDILAPATYCPPEAPVDLAIAMGRTALGREVVELGEQSPLDIINEYFENDRVRAIMLYVSCMWGLDPRESGVGFFVPLLFDRAGMNKCYCYGGSHKFAGALVREVLQAGGLVLENSTATKILMENGRAAGVQTDDGLTLKSKVVLSSLDPHSTFLDLVGKDRLPPEIVSSIEGWKWDKWSFYTLHIVSEEPPRYKCDDPWVNEAFMTVFGIESSEQLLAHWDNVLAGRVGDNFGGHSTCESLFDPHLNRVPNKYVSFFQMHAPYDIEGGWEKRGKELAARGYEAIPGEFVQEKKDVGAGDSRVRQREGISPADIGAVARLGAAG